MTPYLDDGIVTIHCGDALEVLRELPAESVDCCVTSPPFYGLRDYGMEGQIGLEDSPQEWCDRLVAVFQGVRRLLKPWGTCWVEIGDSYTSGHPGRKDNGRTAHGRASGWRENAIPFDAMPSRPGYKPKDLLLQPFLLAMALRADGWWLRQVIVWSKPNAMPESVTDRCTTAHSYVLLLAKQRRYFFDADAIREPAEWAGWGEQTTPKYAGTETASGWIPTRSHDEIKEFVRSRETRESGAGVRGYCSGTPNYVHEGGRNTRSVWTIPTAGYFGAHFATFPPALVRRMILAGTSERGVCPACGKPWEREIGATRLLDGGPGSSGGWKQNEVGQLGAEGVGHRRFFTRRETLGWRPTCSCVYTKDGEVDQPWAPIPAIVLDPFAGSGTTGQVAREHGRHAILNELNPDYCELAARRAAGTETRRLTKDLCPARDGTLNLFGGAAA